MIQRYKPAVGHERYTCSTHVANHLPVSLYVPVTWQCSFGVPAFPALSATPWVVPFASCQSTPIPTIQTQCTQQKKSRATNYIHTHTRVISATLLPNSAHSGRLAESFWLLTLIIKYTALWREHFFCNSCCDQGAELGLEREGQIPRVLLTIARTQHVRAVQFNDKQNHWFFFFSVKQLQQTKRKGKSGRLQNLTLGTISTPLRNRHKINTLYF
jgi:hypothetical protein